MLREHIEKERAQIGTSINDSASKSLRIRPSTPKLNLLKMKKPQNPVPSLPSSMGDNHKVDPIA